MFVGLNEFFAAGGGKVDGVAGADEVFGVDDSVVDGGDDYAFGDEGSEFFHEVEG